MCGSVEEKAFNANMELMGVVESERNAIRKRHVWKLLEEQERVLRSYYAQREGFEKGGQGKKAPDCGSGHVRANGGGLSVCSNNLQADCRLFCFGWSLLGTRKAKLKWGGTNQILYGLW